MSIHRTALVTGGMGCLGEAIAKALHDAGHRVLLTHSPGKENVESWLASRAQSGYHFTAYPADVTNYDSCAACAELIRANGQDVDILVNNAGITRDATLRKLSPVDWNAVLRSNLDSVFNMSKPFCEGMVERGWGRIVNISSVNGSKGAFGQSNYSAAKAGIYGFTKSLALEVARKGVTVNAVSPGYLDSPMVLKVPKEVLESQVITQIPVGRLGQAWEIAALVAFICSEAAGFMTGANVAMNGGQHMY
ncbi:acetoacetyl-CoA reductase [Candidimonas sp. SYP-B2681]|uniref:acetoacetyl-CoA reductase n=1 Tax=Candidimonas sp. SYP-B2681 TaxID=2497686 RepID=UPI0018F3FAAF|nr:acetoacetyl-CoA reductase [Candidimonas sp. SYP-B2681]